jgi:microcystin-dependent protein
MAINPHRKGGPDVPVPDGGTGASTASAGLANLGGLDLAAHAAIDHSGIPGAGSGLPAGVVMDFAGTVVPSGWLECDGASYATAAQPTLFTAIGYTWGGAGANFNVPDFRRRTAVGRGGTGTGTLGNAVGNTGGAETHTLNSTEMPNHNHGVSDPGHLHAASTNNVYTITTDENPPNNFIKMAQQNTGGSSLQVNVSSSTTGIGISATGGSGAHNNMQPSAVVMKIIKT